MWSNVLNLALPAQRLRPDTQAEHHDPVRHTAQKKTEKKKKERKKNCLNKISKKLLK